MWPDQTIFQQDDPWPSGKGCRDLFLVQQTDEPHTQ